LCALQIVFFYDYDYKHSSRKITGKTKKEKLHIAILTSI